MIDSEFGERIGGQVPQLVVGRRGPQRAHGTWVSEDRRSPAARWGAWPPNLSAAFPAGPLGWGRESRTGPPPKALPHRASASVSLWRPVARPCWCRDAEREAARYPPCPPSPGRSGVASRPASVL